MISIMINDRGRRKLGCDEIKWLMEGGLHRETARGVNLKYEAIKGVENNESHLMRKLNENGR